MKSQNQFSHYHHHNLRLSKKGNISYKKLKEFHSNYESPYSDNLLINKNFLSFKNDLKSSKMHIKHRSLITPIIQQRAISNTILSFNNKDKIHEDVVEHKKIKEILGKSKGNRRSLALESLLCSKRGKLRISYDDKTTKVLNSIKVPISLKNVNVSLNDISIHTKRPESRYNKGHNSGLLENGRELNNEYKIRVTQMSFVKDQYESSLFPKCWN